MYHFETVTKSTLELLKKLMSNSRLNSFLLVGGTALALRLGHRISIDIDLFTNKPFNSSQMANLMRLQFNMQIDFNVPIKLTGNQEFNWKKIEKRLLTMVNAPDKVFESL